MSDLPRAAQLHLVVLLAMGLLGCMGGSSGTPLPTCASGDNVVSRVAISDGLVVAAEASVDSFEVRACFFSRSGEDWVEQARLVPDEDEPKGFTSAFAIDSGTVAIGVLDAVHLYRRREAQWAHMAKLIPGDDPKARVTVQSLALAGGILAVGGAEWGGPSREPTGIVLVYREGPDGWAREARILPTESGSRSAFGLSVALRDDDLFVGASCERIYGCAGRGAVFVFRREGSNWRQETRLQQPGGGEDRFFGHSIALAGERLVVGSPTFDRGIATAAGSAHVFERRDGSAGGRSRARFGAGCLTGASPDPYLESVGSRSRIEPGPRTGWGREAGGSRMNRSGDWWKQARRDLAHARHSLEAADYEWAAFAAQQAAEKALKALLFSRGADPWGHSVSMLAEALPADLEVPSAIVDAAKRLDKHYIPARYPNGFDMGYPGGLYTAGEAERAIADANEIAAFCGSHLPRQSGAD